MKNSKKLEPEVVLKIINQTHINDALKNIGADPPVGAIDSYAVAEEVAKKIGVIIETVGCLSPLLFYPHVLIIEDRNDLNTYTTQIHKQAWAGLSVLKVRLWHFKDKCYKLYLAVLNNPTWAEVTLYVNEALHCSSQGGELLPREKQIWFFDGSKTDEKIASFGSLTVFNCTIEAFGEL